jgi:serine/threonine-protein kinase
MTDKASQSGTEDPFKPGDQVDKYTIMYKLGRGGMAVVYQARDESLRRRVALKVIVPEYAADEEFRSRFLNEGMAIAQVDEPHILPIFEAGMTSGGTLFMATKLVSGGDLGALVRQEGQLAADRVGRLVVQVAAALDAAHARDMVHRDVKPSNVLLDAGPGRDEHAYLCDFGITKITWSEEGRTSPGRTLGTPAYMAPEQVQDQPLSERTDEYGLACTAYELLTGTVPYNRGNPFATMHAQVHDPIPAATRQRPDLPPAVDAVLAKGMAKAPGERYRSCGDFAAALRKTLIAAGPRVPADPQAKPPLLTGAGRDPGAGPTIDSKHPVGPPRRRGIALIAGAVALAALACIGIALAANLGAGPSSSSSERPSSTGSPQPGNFSQSSSASQPGGSSSNPPVIPLAALTTPNKDIITSPATFSLDGGLVAGAGDRESTDVYAWNARTGAYIGTLPLAGSVSLEALAFTPDDKSLLVLDAAGGVCRWDLSSTRCSPVLADPSWYGGGTWNSAISGDTGIVARQDQAGTGVDVLSLAAGRQITHVTDPDGALLAGGNYTGGNVLGSAVSLDKDGRVLTVGDARGNLYVWDVTTGKLLATLHFNPATTLNHSAPAATLSPDGRTVLVPDAGNRLQATLWNSSTGANITPADARWPQTWSDIGKVFFSSDGEGIVTYRDDGSGADRWNATTRAYLAALPFSGRYSNLGLEVYAASGQAVLTDDGTSQTFLWRA